MCGSIVIDLDPQTNCSIMIAGPEKWNAMREAERTLDFFFESYIVQQKAKPFKSLIEKNVSDLKGKADVALQVAEVRGQNRRGDQDRAHRLPRSRTRTPPLEPT